MELEFGCEYCKKVLETLSVRQIRKEDRVWLVRMRCQKCSILTTLKVEVLVLGKEDLK
jgi:hypothetical protein